MYQWCLTKRESHKVNSFIHLLHIQLNSNVLVFFRFSFVVGWCFIMDNIKLLLTLFASSFVCPHRMCLLLNFSFYSRNSLNHFYWQKCLLLVKIANFFLFKWDTQEKHFIFSYTANKIRKKTQFLHFLPLFILMDSHHHYYHRYCCPFTMIVE